MKNEIINLIKCFDNKLDKDSINKINNIMYNFNNINIKPDIILVLGSSSIVRIKKAVELAKTYNTKILISGGNYLLKDKMYEYEKYYIYSICHGIDSNRIILEKNSTNTLENINYSFDIIKNLNIKNILVVSNMQHLLRVSLTINKYYSNLDYNYCYIGSIPKKLNKDNWYKNKRSRNIIKGELERLIKYDLI